MTVLLDGQGGDELMAGYLSYVVYYLNDLRKRDTRRWLGQQLAFMAGAWPRFFASLNMREFGHKVYRYLAKGSRPSSLLRSDFEMLAQGRQAESRRLDLRGADALNRHQYQHVIRDSIPGLLHYEDRNSMAFSIEARVPFLDHRLVEFALGVPSERKIHGAETQSFHAQRPAGHPAGCDH